MLPEPTDSTSRVLHSLLTNPFVSFHDFPTGFALRSRISNLRNKHSVDIHATHVTFKNQFGRPGFYYKYSLVYTSLSEKEKLIEKYLSLVKKTEPAAS